VDQDKEESAILCVLTAHCILISHRIKDNVLPAQQIKLQQHLVSAQNAHLANKLLIKEPALLLLSHVVQDKRESVTHNVKTAQFTLDYQMTRKAVLAARRDK
jgi:hypothetical protein